MRIFYLVETLGVIGVGVCPLVSCGDGTPSQAPQAAAIQAQNAADEYRSLASSLEPRLRAALGKGQPELTSEVESALSAARPAIDRLVWATRLEQCDWGIDYSAGLATDLPHLSGMRMLARLLRADAQQAAKAGDHGRAVENVAALVRMSRHVGGKSLIEKRMAFAILACGTLEATANAAQWTRGQRDMVLGELRQSDGADPFGSEAALEFDREMAAKAGKQPASESSFRDAMALSAKGTGEALAALQ